MSFIYLGKKRKLNNKHQYFKLFQLMPMDLLLANFQIFGGEFHGKVRDLKDSCLTGILIQWLFLSNISFPSHTSFSNILSSVLWVIIQGFVNSSWTLSSLHCTVLCNILPWSALTWGFPCLFWEERSRALWTASHRTSRKSCFTQGHAGLTMEDKAAVTKQSPSSCRLVILRDTGVPNGLCFF